MRRVAAGVLMMVVAVVGAAWILAPAEPQPVEPPAKRRLKERLAKLEPIELPDPMPVVGRRAPPAPRAKPGAELPVVGGVMRGRAERLEAPGGRPPVSELVREAIDAPVQPPGNIDDPVLARNRGFWKHNQGLERVEGRLLTRLKRSPDPYEKFEIQVGLAEVYRAKAANLSQFEAPAQWGDVRAERWLTKLDNDLALAEDKANMLLEISQREAARWPENDPNVQRLQQLR